MKGFTPEKVYTKLIHMRKYFTPFNWKDEFKPNCENYTISDVLNNRSFISHYDIYKKICELFPNKQDINSLIYGFFLTSSDNNIYSISLNNASEYIAKWNNIKKVYKKLVKDDVKSINLFLKDKNFKVNDILILRENKAPILYEMYNQDYIHGLTMAFIYSKSKRLDDMMALSSSTIKSIELKIFIIELYKYIKVKRVVEN